VNTKSEVGYWSHHLTVVAEFLCSKAQLGMSRSSVRSEEANGPAPCRESGHLGWALSYAATLDLNMIAVVKVSLREFHT